MPSATRSRSAGATHPAPQAPKLGGGTVKLDAGVFGVRFNMAVVHETVRAELAARRRGTASTKTRGQVSGGGAKPLAPEGHRPGPGRFIPLSDLDGRRHRLRSHPEALHVQDQPQGAPGRTPQRALASRPARVDGPVRRICLRRAVDRAGREPPQRLESGRARPGSAGCRGGGCRQVVPEHRADAGAAGRGCRCGRSGRCRLVARLRGRAVGPRRAGRGEAARSIRGHGA